MRGKILIVYYHDLGYPLRVTSHDMLYCFEEFSECLCYYVNGAFGIPEYLKDIDFDLIIFHGILLSKRSLPKRLRDFMRRSNILNEFKGKRIAFAQDEYSRTNLLCRFMNEFKVQHIFSLAPSSLWQTIYPNIDWEKVKFETVLPGYLNEGTLEKIRALEHSVEEKDIDIGYRARGLRYSLGSHGILKHKIGEVVKTHALSYGLKVDISNRPEDTFLGLDWYRFLLRCKYTIGVEGGASVLDPEGKVLLAVNDYVAKNPDASFEEVEDACFKGLDGNFQYFTLSPRHLEACATRTCQILIEGHYNGILKPGVHYIELKKDFSNIDEVLGIVKEDKLREEIVQRVYKDVVESEKYTCKNFVKTVLNHSLGENYGWSRINATDRELYLKNKKREKLLWRYIPVRTYAIKSVLNVLPPKAIKKIIKMFH